MLKGTSTAMLVIGCLFFLMSKPVFAASINDLDASSAYARQSIEALADLNIVNGDQNANFNPKAVSTRAQMVKLLVLSLGLDISDPPETPTFKDVPANHWAYKYVEAAAREGIVAGVGNNLFGPNYSCTREQMAMMFVSSLESPAKSQSEKQELIAKLKKFTDYRKISSWAVDKVADAVDEGIMSGVSTTSFAPEMPITREQMVVVADRFISYSDPDEKEVEETAGVFASEKGFAFMFTKPVKNVFIHKVTDSKGKEIQTGYKVIPDNFEYPAKLVFPEDEAFRFELTPENAYITRGETYTVDYSFVLGGIKEKVVHSQRTVTASAPGFAVESAPPVNASQIRIRFTHKANAEEATDIKNYSLKDMSGNAIGIKNVCLESDGYTAVLTMSAPIAGRKEVQITADMTNLQPFTGIVVIDDKTPPRILSVDAEINPYLPWIYDKITVTFSEPVYSGKMMLNNSEMGDAAGEVMVLRDGADGTASNYVYTMNLSDGVNTNHDPDVRVLPQRMGSSQSTNDSPVVTGISYDKDSTGRVKELIISFSNVIAEDAGYSGNGIQIFDKYGRPVYCTPVRVDDDGQPLPDNGMESETQIPLTYVCYTSKPVGNGSNVVVFPIAPGVNIYGGKYKVFVDNRMVWNSSDSQPNLEKTLELDFDDIM